MDQRKAAMEKEEAAHQAHKRQKLEEEESLRRELQSRAYSRNKIVTPGRREYDETKVGLKRRPTPRGL